MLFKKKEDMPKPNPKAGPMTFKGGEEAIKENKQKKKDVMKELFPNEGGMGSFTERRNKLKGD
jgi:hypothetical protein